MSPIVLHDLLVELQVLTICALRGLDMVTIMNLYVSQLSSSPPTMPMEKMLQMSDKGEVVMGFL